MIWCQRRVQAAGSFSGRRPRWRGRWPQRYALSFDDHPGREFRGIAHAEAIHISTLIGGGAVRGVNSTDPQDKRGRAMPAFGDET